MVHHEPAFVTRPSPAGAMTLADVIGRIEGDEMLSASRRRDMLSALRTLCRQLGADPTAVPAQPQIVRQRLESIGGGVGGLSGPRLVNVRSLTLAALKHVGVQAMAGRCSEPLMPAWAALKKQLRGRAARYALSRLISYFSARQIVPDLVDAASFEQFRVALESESFVKAPREVYRNACIFWNRASESVPEWPDLTVAVPSASRRYALEWSEFPESLRNDTEAYLHRMANQDPFADDYAPSARPSSVAHRRRQLRLIATALVRSGVAAEALTGLSVLVEPENAKIALRFFLDRTGKKTTAIHELARLLVTIARYWVKPPEDQLRALVDLSRRLRVKQSGMTEKNRARLRQFDDAANLGALLTLPDRILREAPKGEPIGYRDAVRVMRALAVRLLTCAPIRIRNLTRIEIERHLVRTRVGADAVVHLVLPGEEVKNHEDYELPLPADVVDLLDLYIHRFRPRLFTGISPWLFPNESGQARDPATFAVQLRNFIRAETDLRVNVHLFRHLSAKLQLEACPGDLDTVRRLLGHKSVNTTLKAYADLTTKSAFQRYDNTIANLREDALKRPQPPRRRRA